MKKIETLILQVKINNFYNRLVPASCSAFYKRNFKEPGLYYFQTEARNYEQKNICLVEVYQSYRYFIFIYYFYFNYF